MKFSIQNDASPLLVVSLNKDESILAEPGTMLYLSPDIEFESKNSGDIDDISYQMSSMDVVEKTLFRATGDNSELALSPKSIGSDILHIKMRGNTIYCDGNAYLASSTDFDFKIQGTMKSVLSGNGLYLQKIDGEGDVFLEVYGSTYEKELQEGESLIIDYGHLVAFESTLEHKLLKPRKGTVNSISIGEWIVTRFTGPGKIWLQSRNRSENADSLKKYL